MTADIFISYSSMDAEIANNICNYLEKKGLTCWIAPRDIRAGYVFGAEIVGAIKTCKVLVLVYSNHSNLSKHVANEIDRAFANGKIIIPFKIEETPLCDGFEYYLSNKHWINAVNDPQSHFVNLLNHCKSHCNIQPKELDNFRGQSFHPDLNDFHNSKPKTENKLNKPKAERDIFEMILKNMVEIPQGSCSLQVYRDYLASCIPMTTGRTFIQSFQISKYAVKVIEFKMFCDEISIEMPPKPRWGWNDHHPIVNITWNEAVEYCNWLSIKLGKTVRLPSYAEWEYVSEEGIGRNYSGNSIGLESFAWYKNNSNSVQPVGKLSPDRLGIYDLLGNVWEYVDFRRDGMFHDDDDNEIIRGSSYNEDSFDTYPINHVTVPKDGRYDNVGMRIVMDKS